MSGCLTHLDLLMVEFHERLAEEPSRRVALRRVRNGLKAMEVWDGCMD